MARRVCPNPPKTKKHDVAVVDLGRRPGAAAVGTSTAALATVEPVLVEYHTGPILDRFVQIIDRTDGNRVITAIELLSPWNKGPGTLNKAYRKKLDDYARGGVSIVEIDLLRFPLATDCPSVKSTPRRDAARHISRAFSGAGSRIPGRSTP